MVSYLLIVNALQLVIALAACAKGDAEADPGFVYSVGHLPIALVAVAPALTYATVPVTYTVPAAGCQNSEGAFVPCNGGQYFGLVPVAAAPAAEDDAPEVSVEKRDAEAEPVADVAADPEADPWLYYSGLYGHGYGYGHYASLTYSYAPYTYSHVYGHYGLGHYGLPYYGRKKREAEAEPEAVADPEADPG